MNMNQKAHAVFTRVLLETESFALAIKAEKDFRKANNKANRIGSRGCDALFRCVPGSAYSAR